MEQSRLARVQMREESCWKKQRHAGPQLPFNIKHIILIAHAALGVLYGQLGPNVRIASSNALIIMNGIQGI
ncbi:MAG: hypothetical protein GC205_09820 [Bacteroidetes bacterium]|nr:hypothetical protein [Bacteroidota bacterium]